MGVRSPNMELNKQDTKVIRCQSVELSLLRQIKGVGRFQQLTAAFMGTYEQHAGHLEERPLTANGTQSSKFMRKKADSLKPCRH